VLKREGVLERVLAAAPERQRALFRDPPAATAWIPIDDMDHLQQAIEDVLGAGECRRISRDAMTVGVIPLLQSFVSGLLRLFGASPHTLFSRLGELMKFTTFGVDYQCTRTDDRSCRVRIGYPHRRGVRAGAWESVAGGLESAFIVCYVKGIVSAPMVVANGHDNAADFDIRW
jgi:hypothetical protein